MLPCCSCVKPTSVRWRRSQVSRSRSPSETNGFGSWKANCRRCTQAWGRATAEVKGITKSQWRSWQGHKCWMQWSNIALTLFDTAVQSRQPLYLSGQICIALENTAGLGEKCEIEVNVASKTQFLSKHVQQCCVASTASPIKVLLENCVCFWHLVAIWSKRMILVIYSFYVGYRFSIVYLLLRKYSWIQVVIQLTWVFYIHFVDVIY